MKKLITFFPLLFLMSLISYSQEMGYKTTDVGAEFMNSAKGYNISLHLAFNAEVHNSFQTRIGYYNSNWGNDGKHNHEQGNGFGFSLGYRYYFLVRPHGFFLGIRADVAKLKINWRQGLITGTTKIWALQPAAEIGYMFLVNDLLFITPAISASYQKNIQTEGQPVGEGLIPQFGVSAGIKF